MELGREGNKSRIDEGNRDIYTASETRVYARAWLDRAQGPVDLRKSDDDDSFASPYYVS